MVFSTLGWFYIKKPSPQNVGYQLYILIRLIVQAALHGWTRTEEYQLIHGQYY